MLLDIEISKEIYLEPFFAYTPAKEEGIFTRTIIIKIKGIVREILWKWKTAGGSVI